MEARQVYSGYLGRWVQLASEQLEAEDTYLRYLDVLYARYHHPSCLGDLMPQITSGELAEFNRLATAAGFWPWTAAPKQGEA